MAQQKFKRFVVMSQDILEDPNLSVGEKILLARYSGFSGEIFESPTETGKFLNMSAVTVKRHRLSLEKLGYIKCIGNNGHGKRYVVVNEKLTGEVYQNDTPGVSKVNTENKIKNIVISKDITASQPKVAPQTSRKKSEFNLLIEKLCEILSLDVTKLNWSAVGKWHKVGKESNCTNEDFIKAAEAMRDAAKANGFTVSLQKVLTNTEYWLRQAEDKKPKRGMIIT